ncbi:GNAT family protein [Nostoc sp. NMS9]|uniref:GNAT family N-acetyltransferase n=1 Tax=Nostoc sp. NMS9 TaxID=2815393 RepID=UPI0025E0A907|nr:GNAT family protein [Nostoc sp. NMS9]MBN3939340.1 GNAT family N-acetyltransferase [Nostoc sp. NMS9]
MFRLREISRQDITTINTWRNDYEIINFLGCNFLYISEEIDNKWYENYLNNRDKNVRLSIIESDNNHLIGNVYLTNIQSINCSAEFSIVISNKNYWSRGIGEAVCREIIKHAFINLNLNRIYLYVLEENTRAIRMYEKVGFLLEGKLEEAVYKNGSYHNTLLMAILRKNYNKDIQKNKI